LQGSDGRHPGDFFNDARIIGQPRNTMNKVGSNVTNVIDFPGLNTLGISLARIDYGPLV
jgi:hypothetical protein